MTHPVWPFFDLQVTTPRIELRGLDDTLALELVQLAANGVHDSAEMPFLFPWTDVPSPQLERNALQFHWRNRAEISPTRWSISLAALVDGAVVGTTALDATDFPTLRQFETGSWLGRAHQGRGLGTEMRLATLHLGFDGFGAQMATTSAWEDNHASLGVTGKLGYTPTGQRRAVSRDQPRRLRMFELGRDEFAVRLRREDIVLSGVDACLPLLGL